MKKQYIPKYPIMEDIENNELIDTTNLTPHEVNELQHNIKKAIKLCDKIKDKFSIIFGEHNG